MDLQNIIYEYLCSQEDNRKITSNKTEEFFADETLYLSCVENIKERLKVKLNSGKCSTFLIHQLAKHRCNLGEKFGNKIEFYNASEICDLIELIENEKTIGDDFNGVVLTGFSKIHHGSHSGRGYSIIRNIKEFWFKNKKIRPEKLNNYSEIIEQFGEQNIQAIINTMYDRAISEKQANGELNGEWLIYKKYNNCYFYLCLATHSEGDQIIYTNKLANCLNEFPELTT